MLLWPSEYITWLKASFRISAMAKLHERPIIEEIDESSDPARFDGDLEKVLIGHSDNVEDFLKTVFGFLDRNSRFFKQSDASKKIARLADSVSPASASGKVFKGGFLGKAGDGKGASKVGLVCGKGWSASCQRERRFSTQLVQGRHRS